LRFNLGTLPLPELKNLQNALTLFNQGKFSEASEHFSSAATHLETEQSRFWAAVSRENEGKSLLGDSEQQSNQELAIEQALKGKEALLKAAKNYEAEAKILENADAIFLAERARSDKAWCESHATES
jgi:hypothetical protein